MQLHKIFVPLCMNCRRKPHKPATACLHCQFPTSLYDWCRTKKWLRSRKGRISKGQYERPSARYSWFACKRINSRKNSKCIISRIYFFISIKYLFCWIFLLTKLKLYEISEKNFSHKMCGNYIHSKPKVEKHFQHCPAVTYKDHCCTKVTKVTKEGIRFP